MRKLPPERLVLVGFMGSGKSTVGPLLAEALGWRFVDQDREVEEEAGCSIREIFAAFGEGHFRELEGRVARRLLGEAHVVMASGGGWGAVQGRLSRLPSRTFTVWLRVSADEALRRAGEASGTRPLLSVPDPRGHARRLLQERGHVYREADLEVDTEGLGPEDVSARILELVLHRHPDLESPSMRLPNG